MQLLRVTLGLLVLAGSILGGIVSTVSAQQQAGTSPVSRTELLKRALPPGTVHDLARNPSKTARARLLVVYIGEEGKAPTVPIR